MSGLSRRSFMKAMSGCLAAMSLRPSIGAYARLETPADVTATGDKPNVLFLILDDLNDWVGCMGGYAGVQTPNIDRLASRGVLFTNAHCNAPLCNPSRVSFLTGARPSTSGVYDNGDEFRDKMPDAVTIPQHFMRNGYEALGAGKVFHLPDAMSWNTYFPTRMSSRPLDPMPPVRPLSGIPGFREALDWGPMEVDEEEMADASVSVWAAEQLGRMRQTPFFLAVGIFKPHLPWYIPRRFLDSYPINRIHLPATRKNDLDDVPAIARRLALSGNRWSLIAEHHQEKQAIAGYLASVTFADAQVGRILDALDRSPYAQSTIVILVGDNGYHHGEKQHHGKRTLWERSTRVPLIVVVPGITPTGKHCKRAVSLLDLYPTLVETCGLKKERDLEGTSLLPLLKNPGGSRNVPAVTTVHRNSHSVRSNGWRYTRYRDGTEELYNHQPADPGYDPQEWKNLAGKSKYASIKKELQRWLPKANV